MPSGQQAALVLPSAWEAALQSQWLWVLPLPSLSRLPWR